MQSKTRKAPFPMLEQYIVPNVNNQWNGEWKLKNLWA